ncbi:hypothetical protein EVAR_50606_1 [Eumeta japonica]|uniref:Uncharacterized protein n=1 Tax=Eumeta variegata TaxID=151549 RepID=A0A4C1Y6M8_EUMVA|nr:hypothetical protein EVAR_50606_1 [Eumeta japonica]
MDTNFFFLDKSKFLPSRTSHTLVYDTKSMPTDRAVSTTLAEYLATTARAQIYDRASICTATRRPRAAGRLSRRAVVKPVAGPLHVPRPVTSKLIGYL